MRDTTNLDIAWLCVAGLLGTSLGASAREGFGMPMLKKTAHIQRVTPAAVPLFGTRIQVKCSGQGSDTAELAQRLRSQLESELVGRDPRLVVAAEKVETEVVVEVLQNDYQESWENRRVMKPVIVGKDSKGKQIIEMREAVVRYKIVSHSFRSSYKVLDVRKSTSLDADSLAFSSREDFAEGNGAPARFDLEAKAVDSLVDAVARRVTPTPETIQALLPKGSFEKLIPLAQGGQWNTYLEMLQAMSPLADSKDDSYRLYAMGTAFEALGYQAEKPETTLRYLEQASLQYNAALRANPGEKFFSKDYDASFGKKQGEAPLDRVRQALVNYRRIQDFQAEYEKQTQEAAEIVSDAGKSLSAGPSVPVPAGMTNQDVIDMVAAGLGEDVILKAIQAAPQHAFDASPAGLIALARGKVNTRLVKTIQDVANRKKPPVGSSGSQGGKPGTNM